LAATVRAAISIAATSVGGTSTEGILAEATSNAVDRPSIGAVAIAIDLRGDRLPNCRSV
jgi:hypothetical protein